ncbi:MAG TPA: CHASE3 domain-containing protein, partial [Allosphingosinicella sp.]|nr:CHASE3 domain-containing protein [Allosphingosinicella sp.]
MADEETGAAAPDEGSAGSWRRGWASAGAILATVLLIGLIAMVTISNRQRDEALAWERHAYDVMLLTRTADATMARSEAALGRYVLNEVPTTGTQYYLEWRAAGRQLAELQRLVRRDPEQRRRSEELQALYTERGQELSTAASAAAQGQDSGGVPWFFQAGLSPTGPALRAKLEEIAKAERQNFRKRVEQSQVFAEQARKFTEWLGWLGVLIGFGAIVLGLAAYRAITERLVARQEADTEASRAMALEQAVQERTRELSDANERLLAEAAEREAAEAQLRQVQKMEAVGQLTGGIAHDFNNMLAVVMGGLALLKRRLERGETDVVRYVDAAMEGAGRAAALTQRLLAFSRRQALSPAPLDVNALVTGMTELLARTLGERIRVETA